ncbi:hypothetical protein D3C81_1426450 [compost metagenome]
MITGNNSVSIQQMTGGALRGDPDGQTQAGAFAELHICIAVADDDCILRRNSKLTASRFGHFGSRLAAANPVPCYYGLKISGNAQPIQLLASRPGAVRSDDSKL